VRRTLHGIPHILGRSFRDVGYGYGYAFAQDNICQIASSYVTARGERSRFFGPNESWKFEGNSTTAIRHPGGRRASRPPPAERPATRGQGRRARLRGRLQPLPAGQPEGAESGRRPAAAGSALNHAGS